MSRDPDELFVADFDYDLPPELIAQAPPDERDGARLFVLDRARDAFALATVLDLPSFLEPGDLLVANNSRVIPARLHAVKVGTGGRVELLLLRALGERRWEALARPARRLHPGDRLSLVPRSSGVAGPSTIEVVGRGDEGVATVRFLDDGDDRLGEFGEAPLPPYIRESLADEDRYQTLHARVPGSVAAPTAGLHVTPRLRAALSERGVGWAEVTLHVGLDTFRPVTAERVSEHAIHSEWCAVDDAVAAELVATKARGGRVVALGTTAARTLETLGASWDPERPAGFVGPTRIFITPGYDWRIVDAMVTNFHLPRSTLLMMISAFAGRERVLRAYHEAIARRYRFYSFGDAMLIV